MNGNLVNKKHDDEEIEEYEELPEEQEENKEEDDEEEQEYEEIEETKEKTKSKKSLKPEKKITRYMLIFMAVFTILIIIVWFISLFINKKYSYEDIEEVLKEAAVDYFADYKDSLPKEDGQIVEIDSSNLVQAKKMKELSKYTGSNIVCTGSVQVEKTNDTYLYTPYLDCGETYKTQEFTEAIISQGLANQGEYGLYKINGEYVYRGENLNNYVELDTGLWRIVKITSNNNVVLIKQEKVGLSSPYDNRYNIEKKYNSGINNYSSSRIKDNLETYYKEKDVKSNNYYLSSDDKTHIVKYNLCVGKRTETDTGNSNEKECSEIEKDVKVGLLTASDFMKASLDTNCVNTTSNSCGNYNYLVSQDDYWLATSNAANSYESFYVRGSASIRKETSSSYKKIRPVIYLNSNTMFKSGTGSESKPFKIK